ncbi:DEAD/DEAH box helicase [Methylocaldum szegediense]|uniref:ATP-dependent RNA helicase DeaD n=1 Tax=Methylocaldum szegediense TaxID=73780 RepID=A0ABN8XC98_9GAMM|nr:DEAD/DEAH box helicase [Methylocaldum szegediense]CAI8920876.1 ATP-dependent RNA helicase DeaD [Methylocaldum szegediense]
MTSSTSISSFEQLAIAQPVLRALREIGYEAPSPIQAQSIPHLLEGKDLLGQAQTGTGKTAAFAIPVLTRIDLSRRVPQALVLAPTRELAIQVAEAFQTYARHLDGFHILPVYGGQGMGSQLRQLARGVHVVVGTPGRVMDHLRRGTLSLNHLTTLVLDEADEMLRMGFIEDVEWILEQTPPHRQIALFSATMPEVIRKIANRHLNNAVEVKIKAKTATVDAINQRYWLVSGVQKLEALTRILDTEDFDAMIIFVRTKTETVELAEKLEARGHEAAALNGDMSQGLREKVIDRLRKGTLDIVVATDVAARGLDVERVTHVVNYDIPYDSEAYIHRIGRTGRAGRKGKAILFVAPRERRMLRTIEQTTRQSIQQMRLPTLQDIADRRIEQLKAQLVQALDDQDVSFYRDLVDKFVAEGIGDATDIAAALAYLMHRERPLQALEEPEPPVPGHARERSREKTRPESGLLRYSLAVGREHGVQPKDIVGAIANETGLSPRLIGQIKLFDAYSTVELPADLPDDFFRLLKKTWVKNQRLNLQLLDNSGRKPHRKSTTAEAGKSGKLGRPKASSENKSAAQRRPTNQL